MSSSTTNLCDLPPELVGLIAERTDIRSRCVLRKSSRDIRQVVDDSKHVCSKIEVSVNWSVIKFKLDGIPPFVYAPGENNCVISRNSSAGYKQTTLNGEDYVEVAVNDLMTILKNPKLIVKEFVIDEEREYKSKNAPFTAALHRKLCELNHKLHVESISLTLEEDDMLLILPFCKPKILKNLCLSESKQNQLTRINTMEHWKQAEVLDLKAEHPLKDIFHFKQVSMSYHSEINASPSWEEFKTFMEKIVAEGEHSPKKFTGWGLDFSEKLKEYTRNMETVPGGWRKQFVLKTFKDGSKIVLLFSDYCVVIDKYVDGKSVFRK